MASSPTSFGGKVIQDGVLDLQSLSKLTWSYLNPLPYSPPSLQYSHSELLKSCRFCVLPLWNAPSSKTALANSHHPKHSASSTRMDVSYTSLPICLSKYLSPSHSLLWNPLRELTTACPSGFFFLAHCPSGDPEDKAHFLDFLKLCLG